MHRQRPAPATLSSLAAATPEDRDRLVAVLQLSLLMLARPALLRWLRRPGPWRATIVVNTLVMTLFLWHITGLVLAAGTAYLAGVPLPDIGSAQWWLQKPVWLLAATAVTALLVRAFHPWSDESWPREGGPCLPPWRCSSHCSPWPA